MISISLSTVFVHLADSPDCSFSPPTSPPGLFPQIRPPWIRPRGSEDLGAIGGAGAGERRGSVRASAIKHKRTRERARDWVREKFHCYQDPHCPSSLSAPLDERQQHAWEKKQTHAVWPFEEETDKCSVEEATDIRSVEEENSRHIFYSALLQHPISAVARYFASRWSVPDVQWLTTIKKTSH